MSTATPTNDILFQTPVQLIACSLMRWMWDTPPSTDTITGQSISLSTLGDSGAASPSSSQFLSQSRYQEVCDPSEDDDDDGPQPEHCSLHLPG